LEARLVDLLVAVEEQVEVDRARPETRSVASDAAQAALDRQQPLEQLARAQRGAQLGRAVEKARLVLEADRVGLAQARDRDQSCASAWRSARAVRRCPPVRRARRSFWSWPRLSVIPLDSQLPCHAPCASAY
jgi:hypothetical protein